MKKPNDITEYIIWLKNELQIDISSKTKTYYESVASKIKSDFESSNIWHKFISDISNYNKEYYLRTSYYLFSEKEAPKLLCKSYDSILDKTYRKNVLLNSNWPNPPDGGWITPDSWFSRINDVVRTVVVVKYLDGIDDIIKRFDSLCSIYNHQLKVDYEAKDEGYYAVHLYISIDFHIPGKDWDTVIVKTPIEIQITTQLQEVIRKLLHKYYDANRLATNKPEKKWQWNYKSDEFSANYLGHILHYLEGMILDVRDKKGDKQL